MGNNGNRFHAKRAPQQQPHHHQPRQQHQKPSRAISPAASSARPGFHPSPVYGPPAGSAGGAAPMDGLEDGADPRASPGKITHGFWLQQYNWLHASNQAGAGQQHQGQNQNQSQAKPATAKRRLLAKWNNLKRTFGGSQAESVSIAAPHLSSSTASGHSAPSTAHSTLQARRGSSQRDRWAGGGALEPAASPGGRRADKRREQQQRKSRSWFLRSVSSSAGSLLQLGGGQQSHPRRRVATPERPASAAHMGPASASDTLPPPGDTQSPSKRASPYRQIAKVLTRTKNKAAAQLSPSKRTRKRPKVSGGAATIRADYEQVNGDDDTEGGRADVSADNERHQTSRRKSSVSAPRPAAPSSNQRPAHRGPVAGGSPAGKENEWRQSTGAGILSSIFVSPRLFRRAPRKQSVSTQVSPPRQKPRPKQRQRLRDGKRSTATIRAGDDYNESINNDDYYVDGGEEDEEDNDDDDDDEPIEVAIGDATLTLDERVELRQAHERSISSAAPQSLLMSGREFKFRDDDDGGGEKKDKATAAAAEKEEEGEANCERQTRDDYANERPSEGTRRRLAPGTPASSWLGGGGGQIDSAACEQRRGERVEIDTSRGRGTRNKEDNNELLGGGTGTRNIEWPAKASDFCESVEVSASRDKAARESGLKLAFEHEGGAGQMRSAAVALVRADDESAAAPIESAVRLQQQQQQQHLLKLVQPASSSSSFASSSICLDSVSHQSQDPLAAVGPGHAPAERPVSQPAPASDRHEPEQTGGVGTALKDNFRKLVKRQQSVDSYRMARELKRKQKQQNESRHKHQSNEAIKTQQQDEAGASRAHYQRHAGRKFSMRSETSGASKQVIGGVQPLTKGEQTQLKICIDPYAEAGSFNLYDAAGASAPVPAPVPGAAAETSSARQTAAQGHRRKSVALSEKSEDLGGQQKRAARVGPTPPNTLSLMLSPHMSGPTATSSLMLGTFSGCITPTYPTHHLPSPKYVSPALVSSAKKYSNASTISSSYGAEPSLAGAQQASGGESANQSGHTGARANQNGSAGAGMSTCTDQTNISDTESSIGGAGSSAVAQSGQQRAGEGAGKQPYLQVAGAKAMAAPAGQSPDEAAAAARRANLAEHIYDNKCGLSEDMKFLASLPELCDITFLVGETREPVCAVKSVLAARSRVFHKILFGNRLRRIARQQHQEEEPLGASQDSAADRRGSSPKPASGHKALTAKQSSPMSRSTSPQQQHWTVTSDTSGYNTSPVPAGGDDTAGSGSAGLRSGRVSVTSNGRESVGQASQGSQQPLIIGPGQTATPAKRTKKSSLRDAAAAAIGAGGSGSHHHHHHHHHHHSGASRLSRMFLKRASDPSIKQQQQHGQLQHQQSGAGLAAGSTGTGAGNQGQSYLDKMSSSQMSTTMIIEEFEPDVFRQLIEYIHTGCVLLQARTLLGLLNAADYYGLEQLRKACLRFVSCCITVDTVCSLLSTAERYIQYKCTKSIVQKVLEFVDSHANEIFKLNAFGLLPEHVVRLILARDGLQADEQVKYNGVYTWCEHYCRSYELTNISDVMQNFLDLINFHKIPTNVLLSEIYPTHIVPDTIFLSALAYQADPENFEPQPTRQRRMTLPNPMIHKDYASDDDAAAAADDDDADQTGASGAQLAGLPGDQEAAAVGATLPIGADTTSGVSAQEVTFSARQQRNRGQRKSSQQNSSSTGGSQERLVSVATTTTTARVTKFSENSEARRHSPGFLGDEAAATPTKQAAKLRKGSLAQVSISGVKRLSHKLSIRRRAQPGAKSAGQQAAKSSVSKQQSLASATAGRKSAGRNSSRASATSKSSGGLERDPLQVGQQILNSYLEAQRQRELQEEERKRRELAERKSAATGAVPQVLTGAAGESAPGTGNQQQQAGEQAGGGQSRRKSFRDFKHISRRIFQRHSNSKLLQQSASNSIGASSARDQSASQSFDSRTDTSAGAEVPGAEATTKQNRRHLLKIKRSETVFESAASSKLLAAKDQSKPVNKVARLTHQLSSNFAGLSSPLRSKDDNKLL